MYTDSGGGAPGPGGARCERLCLRKMYIAPSAITTATTAPTTIPPIAPPDSEVEGLVTTVTVLCPFVVGRAVEAVVPVLVVKVEEAVWAPNLAGSKV